MFTNYTHLIMFILGGLFNLKKYMYKVVFPVNDILHCSIWEMSVHRLSFIGCVRAVYSKNQPNSRGKEVAIQCSTSMVTKA